jgi:transcriptional regulator with XRE-family HTH domain
MRIHYRNSDFSANAVCRLSDKYITQNIGMGRPLTDLGRRLVQALEARDLSRRQLSADTGVAYATISEWMSGDTQRPRGDSLMRVCNRLRIRPDWLLDGVGQRDIDTVTDLSAEARAIAELAHRLPQAELDGLLAYLQARQSNK